MSLEIRNYRKTDFHDLVRLGNELDIHGQNMSEDEVRAMLSLPKADPERNAFMVVEGNQAKGYARIFRNRDLTINRHHVNINLPPHLEKNSAFVDELLARVEARLKEISTEYDMPLQIRAGCYDEKKALIAAFERNRYKLVRYYARLDRHDISNPGQSTPPQGVLIRRFAPDKEKQQYLDACNHASEGDFEYHPLSAEVFDQFLKTPFFQPGLCFVAEKDGRVVGLCENYLTPERERDNILWGIVSGLAVVPEERSKGLGRALIRHGILALRDAGAESICLWMDYANPFGAKKLYYSEGFKDRYTIRSYAKDEKPESKHKGTKNLARPPKGRNQTGISHETTKGTKRKSTAKNAKGKVNHR